MSNTALRPRTSEHEARIEREPVHVPVGRRAFDALRTNFPFIAIFLCATGAALAFHFVFGHPKSTLMYDARSYLWTAGRISQFLIDLSHFQWHPELVCDAQFRNAILNDGPMLTSFFGTAFALLQRVPTPKDWVTIEVLQSILHGLSSGLIYLIAKRVLSMDTTSGAVAKLGENARRFGAVFAGLLWAFYPAAIIGSGYFYTETLVVFAATLFMSMAVSKPGLLRDAAVGITAGFVFLLKPVLAPAAAISCLCRLMFSTKRVSTVCAIGIALACTLAPWALYTHFVMGKMQITTPRFAGYNMAMGADTEAEGRLVIPCTPLTNMFREEEKPVFFLASQWRDRTADMVQMTERKLTRLLGFPWNDYRFSFFGLDPVQQRMLHIAFLFLGLSGFALAAFTRKVEKNSMPVVALMAFMWTPLVYLLFESNSRYGFTIMPLYAVFAGYLVGHLLQIDWKMQAIPAALSVVAGGLLTAGILCAGSIANADKPVETKVFVNPGSRLVSTIDLSKIKRPIVPYEALIFVDGERSLETAWIDFNGHKVDKLAHLRYFDSGLYDGYYVSKEVANYMRAEAEDLRQWRAVRVPKEWINWTGKNEIRITPSSEFCTIYGDSKPNPQFLPSFRSYCPNKLCNADTGYEGRLNLWRPSQITDQKSVIEPSGTGSVQGSARVRLALVVDSPKQKNRNASVSSYPIGQAKETPLLVEQPIKADLFQSMMHSPTGDGTVRINKFILDHVAPSIEIPLPVPVSGDNLYRVKVEGKFKAVKKPGSVSVLLANRKFAVLSKVPPFMRAEVTWQSFEIDDTMPVRLLKNEDGNYSLCLALYPGPWLDESALGASKSSSDVLFSDMKLSVASTKQLNLTGKQVFLY